VVDFSGLVGLETRPPNFDESLAACYGGDCYRWAWKCTVRKDEEKSLRIVGATGSAAAFVSRISVEEHSETLVAKSPTWLSCRRWHIVRKEEEKALRVVRASGGAAAFVGGMSVEEHPKTLVAKSPVWLSRTRRIVWEIENETLGVMPVPCRATAFSLRIPVEEHAKTLVAKPPTWLPVHIEPHNVCSSNVRGRYHGGAAQRKIVPRRRLRRVPIVWVEIAQPRLTHLRCDPATLAAELILSRERRYAPARSAHRPNGTAPRVTSTKYAEPR